MWAAIGPISNPVNFCSFPGSTRRTASAAHARTRVYDEAVRQALTVLWEAADRVCGKRLKPLIPMLVDAMERHGHLDLGPVCQQYVKSRSQKKRPYLRWRSKKKSLGWVPLKGRNLKETPNGFHFHGREFKVFKSRDLPAGAQIKDGTNFSQDRKGNWFLNVCVEVEASVARSPVRGVGIDLGLKDFATLSTGEKIDAQRLYLGAEQALAAELRALAATRWWDRSAEDGPRGVAVKEVAA